jgi:hypothetical protein
LLKILDYQLVMHSLLTTYTMNMEVLGVLIPEERLVSL